MLTLDRFLKKCGDKVGIYKDFIIQGEKALTEKLTICLPDMHLLEKGANDDFWENNPEHESRFLDLLDFLLDLQKEEGENLEIVQLGDMFDLWQGKWNANMIVSAYPSIVGLMEKLKPIYIVGNHDIDLCRWYKDKGETFKRKWRHFSSAGGRLKTIFEHGFQADFCNNQETWKGAIGREVTKIVGLMEYIYPDIDNLLDFTWQSIVRAFSKYNVFTPVRDPQSFNLHEYLNFYINLLEKYNSAQTLDQFSPQNVDLGLAVIAHTHRPRLVRFPKNDRIYYLMDCGSWVNEGHEIGVISGPDMAICQWG